MRNYAIWLAAAALAAMAPLAASAGDSGFYVGAGGGVNFLNSTDISGNGVNSKADSNMGWGALARGGYDYGNGVRTELELNYRSNSIDQIDGVDASGSTKAEAVMLNLLYEFDTDIPLKPYVGGGLGYAHVHYDSYASGGPVLLDDSDNKVAYQGIAGANWEFNSNLAAFADYRYFALSGPSATLVNGIDVDTEYKAHTVMIGLRWKFNKPAPAPMAAAPVAEKKVMPVEAPPPPPEPKAEIPRNFIVFFDFDKSDITPEANRILLEASGYAKQAKVTHIIATGHADRAGPTKYNQALSERRAKAVMSMLVGMGIPKSEIAIFGKGETQPLVPTADGVREPQNRRVEIVLE
jgi:outer membrane protein OmpA-like peptidoglycan-associated protein